VRWRLTLLYGGLFLICGAALLTITYALVANVRVRPPTPPIAHGYNPMLLLHSPAGRALVRVLRRGQRISDLHQLVIFSAVALAIMVVASMLLGWVVAGRVLAPLRTITATTQRISEANLHERLALDGQRDELGQLAGTIDGLLERLEVAFEAQRRFVANASHELRTPLAMMRTTLDVAIGKPEGVPPQLTKLDANLREDLNRADRLLESFLVLARAQYGAVGEQTSVSLEQIVTAALATRRDAIIAKRITVHAPLAPVHVTGAETLLARMVENVIENAVRHNQPDGLIYIDCAIDGDTCRLVVESSGPVLDQRDVALLAQPFRRLAQERTHSQNGHGLGLAIVAAISAAHGGTLDLQAAAQGGLRVAITLPSATLAEPCGASR